MSQVRLPRSVKNRDDFTYAILVRRVLLQRMMGDAFEGRRVRPGSLLSESDLRPDQDYPEQPVLLEYAGSDRAGRGHHRSSQQCYILWRYERERSEWLEVVRTTAIGTEWVEILKPVAAQLLAGLRLPGTDEAELVSRTLRAFDEGIERMPKDGRLRSLSLLSEQIMARLNREEEEEG